MAAEERMFAETKDAAFVYRLQNHGNMLLNSLHRQWKDRKYCDLVILTKNKPLQVHACVVAAFSPKIASLIASSVTQNELLGDSSRYTVEVTFECDVMESVLTALYSGVFQPPVKILKDVCAAVEWLEIQALTIAVQAQSGVIASGDGHVTDSSRSCSSSFLDSALFPSQAEKRLVSEDFNNLNSDVKQPINFQNSAIIKIPRIVVERIHKKMHGMTSKSDADSENSVPAVEVKQEIEDVDNDSIPQENQSNQKRMRGPKSLKQTNPTKSRSRDQSKNKKRRSKSKSTVNKTKASNQDETKQHKREKMQSRKREKANVCLQEKVKACKQDATKARRRKYVKNKLQKKGLKNMSDTLSLSDTVIEADDDDDGQDKALSGSRDGDQSTVVKEIKSEDPVQNELDLILMNIKVMKCTKCHEKFTDETLYQSHLDNHPTYSCDRCDLTFSSKFAQNKHFHKVHIGRDHLTCRSCDFRAQSQVQLRKHAVEVHNERKPFSCYQEGCNFSSRKHHEVLKHMVVHSNLKEYMCDKCSTTFSRQISLTLHQRACYQLQEFLCDFCGQGFNHIQSMRKHRAVVHLGEKRYTCPVCTNTFGDHRNLRRHMLIHDNSFPYSCPSCKQQFRHSNSLKSHIASKHSGENIQLNLSRNLSGALGGFSYKRNMKKDHVVNTMTYETRFSGDKDFKKQLFKKRKLSAQAQICQSPTFSGEFLLPPEDSKFDASGSSELKFSLNGLHSDSFFYMPKPVSQHQASGTGIGEGSLSLSTGTSGNAVSMCSVLVEQMHPSASDTWAEKGSSLQQMPIKPLPESSASVAFSAQNMNPSVSSSVSIPGSDTLKHEMMRQAHAGMTVPVLDASRHELIFQLPPGIAVPLPDLSRHEVSRPLDANLTRPASGASQQVPSSVSLPIQDASRHEVTRQMHASMTRPVPDISKQAPPSVAMLELFYKA